MKHPSFSLSRALLLIAFLCLLAGAARGQTTATWTNADPAGPFWDYGNNWSPNTYPGSGGVTGAIIGAPGGTFCDVTVNLDSLTIAAGGALNLDNGSSLTVTHTNLAIDGIMTEGYGGGPFGAFTNAGTLVKSGGTGTFTFVGDIVFSSVPGSTISVTSGNLQLPGDGGLYDTVTFDPAAGTLIDLLDQGATGAFSSLFQGKLTNGTGTGTVRLSGGLMDGTQRSYVQDPQPCTLAFTGNVFQWTGGTMGGYQNGDIFNNTGVVNIAGSAAKETDAVFTNKGTMIQTGTVGLNIGDNNSGGSLTNTAGAVYDLRTDAGIGQGGYPFNNLGLLKKSAGTGTSTLTVGFNNQGGTVEVDSGTLQLPIQMGGGVSSGGTFKATAPTAVLDLGDGQDFTGTYTGSGSGTVRFSQGSLYTNNMTGATFNFPGSLFEWTGGGIGSYQGGHLFTNAGTMNLSGTNDKTSLANFTNKGTMIQTGTGNFNTGSANSGGSFTNAAGATYNLKSDAGLGQGGYPFTNAGLFEKTTGTSTSIIDMNVTNSGSFVLNTGTVQVGNFTQTSGALNLNGGNFSSANDIVINGGIVEGTGKITGNLVNNSGDLSPGHSPGTITVSGNYTQAAAGVMDMQIGGAVSGTGYDQLKVTGTANLGGTLDVTLINGFKPTLGDVYTLVTGSSINGTFSKVTITGFTAQVDYSTNGVTLTVTTAAPQLLNISTRLNVLTNDNVLIGGFIVTGTAPKEVIIRGLGPSLASAGVAGALANPVLALHKPDGTVITNNNWKDTQKTAITATGLAPTNDLESAIVATLAPGNYTAVLSGQNNGTGVGLIEAYDLNSTAASQLANISTRGLVKTGDNVMIGGFIIGGGTTGNTTQVLVRAIGPSLTGAGITDALANPTLELHDANGNILKSNNNWKDTQQAVIQATGLAPTNDLEAAILDTLAPGNYTAIVRGVNGGTGVGLVEVYNLQ